MSKESRKLLRDERLRRNLERSWRDLYAEHVEQHDKDRQAFEEQEARRLRDPAYAASFGLPPELPDFTIQVLAKARAMDQVEPTKPKINRYDSAGGVPPTALHSVNLMRR